MILQEYKKIVKQNNEFGVKQIKDLAHKTGKKNIDKAREYYQAYAAAVKVCKHAIVIHACAQWRHVLHDDTQCRPKQMSKLQRSILRMR